MTKPASTATRSAIVAFSTTLALCTFSIGCATSPSTQSIGKSSRVDPPRSLEGVHSERIALRTDDPKQVAGVLHRVLNLGRNEASGDVHAVFLERSTGELVVIGTDRGIAGVRTLLSPALVSDVAVATPPVEEPAPPVEVVVPTPAEPQAAVAEPPPEP